jgi:hypothetical protein
MIARKRLNLPASPQILLNIFEVNLFEKIAIDQLVTDALQGGRQRSLAARERHQATHKT